MIGPHILIIDDDDRIRELLSKYLSKNNFVTSTASSTEEANNIMKKYIFDLIIVDYMMPNENGIEFIARLRENSNDLVPIIMLTALNETNNRIEGLSIGADDYISKPFEPKELILRINNVLRRLRKISDSDEISFGEFKFNFNKKTLLRLGIDIRLTDMEREILGILLKKANTVLSREEIKSLYNDINERTIDVQITRIRKKIEDDIKNPRFLKTIRNSGYVFVVWLFIKNYNL